MSTRVYNGLLAIERINAWMSGLSQWALLGMTLIVGYEVMSRYAFNSPTIWAWDINVQLMMILLMLGMADVHRRGEHARVDIITAGLTPRQRAWLNVAMAPVFFFVTVILVVTCWMYFFDSWQRQEAASTLFGIPLYPIKFTLPLGSALLLLQGVVNLARDLRIAITGQVQTTRSES